MRIVVNNPLSEGRRECFYFEEARMNNPEYVEAFKKNYSMQKNYDLLKRAFSIPFGETILEGKFTIYDTTLLTDDFMQAFKLGMHNRWDSTLNEAYDPALNPSMSGCLVSEEDLKVIESTLSAVYQLFGERGLELAREFNLAQAVIGISHYIKFDDPDDIYDLPVVGGQKEITLSQENYEPITRCLDAFSSEIFSSYPNENVKSALFAVPQLLYVDDKFVGEHQIKMMLVEIASALTTDVLKLNNQAYKEALAVCLEMYARNNKETFPKKGTVKQYKSEE